MHLLLLTFEFILHNHYYYVHKSVLDISLCINTAIVGAQINIEIMNEVESELLFFRHLNITVGLKLPGANFWAYPTVPIY